MRNLIKKYFDNPDETVEKVILVSLRGVFDEAISSFAYRIRGLLRRRLLVMTFLGLKSIQKSPLASRLLMLLCTLFLCNCATTYAPRRWLSQPEKTQTDVFGGWMTARYATASGQKVRLVGELIAVSADSVFVANARLFAVAQSEIKSARLVAYNANSASMSGLVVLGTVSTISNGLFLVFTAPLWMIGGSVATGKLSHEPILDYPKVKFLRFAPYARYPQGLPAGIDRCKIKMKEQKAIKPSRRR